MGRTSIFLVLCSLVVLINGDCYSQNPAGSINRLNEQNTNRNNPDRLFDSQNNGKGGYAWGPSRYFYEGSLLRIEWTTQHGCNNPKLCCNTVLQYMCQDKTNEDPLAAIRDGAIQDPANTDTIPTDPTEAGSKTASGDFVYGMHESLAYYQNCVNRQRNKGLFAADQNINRQGAIGTRQNPGGGRRGLECPEERDYWPYWHDSPWRDIAVLTDVPNQACDWFKSHSQNTMSRNKCVVPTGTLTGQGQLPNNKADCLQAQGKWEKVASHGIDPPDCFRSFDNLDNYLGNAVGDQHGGLTNFYDWIIPKEAGKKCVFRIRYNISSTDIGQGTYRCQQWFGDFIDSRKNGDASPVTGNPTITIDGSPLRLAVDTTQFGRTFQDRSHMFYIKERPSSVPSAARIYNMNTRGKRGNIVQVYPATEYDFVPTNLVVHQNDYVHYQFTGSIYNPQGNAGEGRAGTDASNIVQLESLDHSHPASPQWLKKNTALFRSSSVRRRMASLDQTDCKQLAPGQERLDQDDPDNCMKLNKPGSEYFDGGLYQAKDTGNFYVMSTRNNNFTNRGQKASISVVPLLPIWAIVLIAIGGAFFLAAFVVAGLTFYSKTHPHSSIAQRYTALVSKI
jgi:hypothetical protein